MMIALLVVIVVVHVVGLVISLRRLEALTLTLETLQARMSDLVKHETLNEIVRQRMKERLTVFKETSGRDSLRARMKARGLS